jgi:two-component system cell cycle response regulator DivK
MPGTLPCNSTTILIVEDDELNMKLWNDVLEAQGYALLKTRLGLEAIGIAGEHRPDLILLDIRLPDISGFDVARRLKADEATRSIPVIALTAFAQTEHQREALESGCDGYISKPVNVLNFLQTIDTWLRCDS